MLHEFSFMNSPFKILSVCYLGKKVEKNGLYHVQFQDKALESTGNYKYYHPKKHC